MAINPASLFDLPGDPLLDKLKRALSQLHERTEVVEAAASALRAGQVQAVDDLVQQITTNFSELFTDGSVVVQALQEGRYTSADIDGPVLFNVQNALSLSLDVTGPIGFSPAPIVMIGHKASTDDFALARTVSWNRETNTLVVDMLTWVGATGPHSDCYVEVGLLSALAELAMLEEVQTLLGSTQNARDAAAGYRDQAAGHVTSAAGEKDQAVAARNLAQGYATTAGGARDAALGYRDQAAASAALAAASAGQIIDVLDSVDVLPTLNLDLADINGAPFKGNLTRATNGGYRLNSRGILVPTAVNEPVIDYGADGKPKGTGFFGAYTNAALESQRFETAAWTKFETAITANAANGPDGNLTAAKLTEAATTNAHYLAQGYSFELGAVLTASWYIKAAERSVVQIRLAGSGGFANVAVNLATGVITAPTSMAPFSNPVASIEALRDGWYRVSISASTTGITAANAWLLLGGIGTDNYLGVAGSGVFVWGAQLTQTAFPVPYVPTTSGAVVRNVDSFVIGGSDFTDFYNPAEGTVFVDFIAPQPGRDKCLYQIGVTMSDRIFAIVNASGAVFMACVAGGVTQVQFTGPTVIPGSRVRVGFSWGLNAFATSISGAAASTDNSGTVPSGLNSMWVGSRNQEYLNSHMLRLIYWPKALTATDLQRITA